MSVRTTVMIEYAEHLYTDPSLWRITLEYLGACGTAGRAMLAEIVMRVPVDINIASSKGKERAVDGEEDLEMILGEDRNGEERLGEEKAEEERRAWTEWEEKIIKIVDVCKDYGLEDVLYSVCRVSVLTAERSIPGLMILISTVNITSTDTGGLLWTSRPVFGDGQGRTRCWPDRRFVASRVHHKRYEFLLCHCAQCLIQIRSCPSLWQVPTNSSLKFRQYLPPSSPAPLVHLRLPPGMGISLFQQAYMLPTRCFPLDFNSYRGMPSSMRCLREVNGGMLQSYW